MHSDKVVFRLACCNPECVIIKQIVYSLIVMPESRSLSRIKMQGHPVVLYAEKALDSPAQLCGRMTIRKYLRLFRIATQTQSQE